MQTQFRRGGSAGSSPLRFEGRRLPRSATRLITHGLRGERLTARDAQRRSPGFVARGFSRRPTRIHMDARPDPRKMTRSQPISTNAYKSHRRHRGIATIAVPQAASTRRERTSTEKAGAKSDGFGLAPWASGPWPKIASGRYAAAASALAMTSARSPRLFDVWGFTVDQNGPSLAKRPSPRVLSIPLSRCGQRTGWDSNPRYAINVHKLSRPAP